MFGISLIRRFRSKSWRRFGQQFMRYRRDSSQAERRLARTMRGLRREIAGATVDCQSCRSCAQGYPLPHGAWDGGHCCGAQTEQIFTEDEIANLAHGGAKLRHYSPVENPQGCIFRGSTGCVLDAADRPNICGHYLCNALKRELADSGKLKHLEELGDALLTHLEAYRELRRARWADRCLSNR
jgi:hypothetical protein